MVTAQGPFQAVLPGFCELADGKIDDGAQHHALAGNGAKALSAFKQALHHTPDDPVVRALVDDFGDDIDTPSLVAELRARGIPWRLALANWDFATDLLPTHRYSAGGMTAEGLTDASWQWCKDHRDVVQGLLGRPGRRSDLYNPRASILWWIAEFEEQRAKMGEKTDPWRVAAGVFLPAAPYGKRAEKELRAWRSTMAKQDRCVLSQKKEP